MTPTPADKLPGSSDETPVPAPQTEPDRMFEPTETIRIPIIEEHLQVSRRLVETGRVRLVKTVHQTEQTVAIPLMSDELLVERVAMNQLVDALPETRQEGDTTIYPVLQEEYVLQKRLRLVEEIRITRRQVHTTDTQTVTLRQEEIRIERETIDQSDKPAATPDELS